METTPTDITGSAGEGPGSGDLPAPRTERAWPSFDEPGPAASEPTVAQPVTPPPPVYDVPPPSPPQPPPPSEVHAAPGGGRGSVSRRLAAVAA
ncbi:MAG: hypothetical protein M3011_10855, partial [Actinomycetota bacterium]|nr:hypothetical protein [Actinomycetota bacterium]